MHPRLPYSPCQSRRHVSGGKHGSLNGGVPAPGDGQTRVDRSRPRRGWRPPRSD